MKNRIYSLAWATVLSHKRLTICMMGFIILSILAALLPPLILEQIVKQLSFHQEVALLWIVSYFLLIALARLFEVGQNRQMTRFGQTMMHQIRSAMNQKLNRLPAHYFTVYDAASLTSRFVNDVDALDALFTNGIISMFADAFKMLSILGVIWIKSKGLGLLLLMVLPGLFYLTRSFQKRMLKAQLQNRQAIAQVNSYIPEAIQNSRMITQYHCQEFMEQRYDAAVEASYQAIEKANTYDSFYSPIILVISSCVIALMMVMAAMGQGTSTFFGIDVASAVAIIAYINELFTPLESIGMEIQNIQSAVAGVKRMNEFLNEPEREGNDLPAQFEGDSVIRFDHVTFGYGAKKVLVDLSFDIKKNEIITLTGPSGAGKSTILKLICGFYPPQEGHVWINDVEAYRIQDQDKRHLFGYMKQSFDPLVGTIKDQITCFDATFSDQQIQDVLAFVGLKATVDSFSKGMDTPFESILFSQGQLQLLSLARAIVGNPPILLLDEMSANLDSKTQQIIQEALHKASQNRTVISISHRNFELDSLSRQINIK